MKRPLDETDDDHDDSSPEQKEPCLKKRIENLEKVRPPQSMPPLPAFFAAASRPRDDPAKHQGRIRSKLHVRNSWATRVYAKVPKSDAVQQILDHLLGQPQMNDNPETHISLTRTIFLKEHQLSNFAAAISKALDASRFILSFAQIAVLTNDDQTRSFATLEVGHGYNEFARCLKPIDEVIKAYNHPEFYKPPRFHASIAWSLSEEAVTKAVESVPASLLDDLTQKQFQVTTLYIEMGNRVVQVPLRAPS